MAADRHLPPQQLNTHKKDRRLHTIGPFLYRLYVIAHIGQLCKIFYVPFSVLAGRKPPTEIRYGLVDIAVIIHSFQNQAIAGGAIIIAHKNQLL